MFDDPSHSEWDVWDYRLFKAHHVLKNWYRDGIPVWWDESDRVTFDAIGRVSKSRAAIERAQDAAGAKGKKSVPGRYFIAEPRLIDGDDMPTREEWVEEQSRKNGDRSVSTKFGSSNDRQQVVQGRK